jgi:hypothetical protein
MIALPSFKPPLSLASEDARKAFAHAQRLYQWSTLALSLRRDLTQYPTLQHELRLFKEVVLELQRTPPIGLTLDLFSLWRKADQFVPRPLRPADEAFSRLLLRQQNELYYRLLRCPTFHAQRSLLLALPDTPPTQETRHSLLAGPPLSLRDRALVFLVTQLYQPITPALIESFRPHEHPAFSTEALPQWARQPLMLAELLEHSLGRPGWLSEHINSILTQFMRCNEATLLPESNKTLLLHFDALPTKLQRIRWQHMTEAASAIPESTQRNQLLLLREQGYQELLLPMRSRAPEGGYHGISRQGPIENLLHSELAYWEDDDALIDPFSLRWIEGELLFFEREQSHSLTWQRHLTIVLDLDPGEIRYKGPNIPVAGHALLFGLLARILQDLRDICPEEILSFRLLLTPEKEWEEESELLRLFFTQLPDVGASTTFQLASSGIDYLAHHPPRMGEMRLFVLSRSRWDQYREAEASCPHHRTLLFGPSPLAATQEPANTLYQQLPDAPDMSFDLHVDGEPFAHLAAIRDRVLESILQTSLVPTRTSS